MEKFIENNLILRQLRDLLSLEADSISSRQTVVLCLIAYLFGMVCRSFYFFNALDNPSILLDGAPMISTEDGYLFAQISKAIIEGYPGVSYKLFLVDEGKGVLSLLTWLFVKITPWSLEQVAVFLPMFFAPLLVIPLIYIGRQLGNTLFGFFAALTAVIAFHYYRRTSFGYYDTDLFSLTGPCFMVLGGIYIIFNPQLRNTLLVTLSAFILMWLDKPQIIRLILMVIIPVYAIRNYRHPDAAKSLILLITPILQLWSWYMSIPMVAAIGFCLLVIKRYLVIPMKVQWTAVVLYGLWAFYAAPVFGSVRFYIWYYGAAGRGVSQGGGEGWNFYQVTGTIVEARKITWQQFISESTTWTALFVFSMAGAVLSFLRYPVLVIGSVLLGIALFSLQGGVRFALFIVPIIALGGAYMTFWIKRHIAAHSPIRFVDWAFVLIMLGLFLYPPFDWAYNQRPRSVAHAQQVAALSQLAQRTDKIEHDYILSWWDYGYVMTYYTNMRNLINGAKHNEDNYLISKAFSSSSQTQAAHLFRESVEALAEKGGKASYTLFGSRQPGGKTPEDIVKEMARDDYVLTRNKTREIYIYIPYQMIRIYAVVRYFSDLSLTTGRLQRPPLLIMPRHRVDRDNNRLLFSNGMSVQLNTGELRQGGQLVGRVNTIYDQRVQDGQLAVQAVPINGLGNYYVLLSPYYGASLIMSPQVFRSNFIQMFFFNNYDQRYFEQISRDPLATIFRLKI